MIDAIFSQPNYVAAKKALDAVALRHEAIATNIANLETPGYKRMDLAPSFQSQLQRATAAKDAAQIAGLEPTLAPDAKAVAHSPDGNTVTLENELVQLSQNTMAHTLETQLITGALMRLKLAISGKNS